MATNLCFHHDRSIDTFIYVQQLSIHTTCAMGHEFTHPPGINETVVLYAWNQECYRIPLLTQGLLGGYLFFPHLTTNVPDQLPQRLPRTGTSADAPAILRCVLF